MSPPTNLGETRFAVDLRPVTPASFSCLRGRQTTVVGSFLGFFLTELL